ncbi:MAG: hypothetical protein KF757_10555 [Phycisphaeraceae bacterium]|nr:hypothetical protein [Phycisphaeraceae bacterium]
MGLVVLGNNAMTHDNRKCDTLPLPLFVLLPDEGTIRVIEGLGDLVWHEQQDLDDEVHWCWDEQGMRYRLRVQGGRGYFLEPATTNETDLFLIIARWVLFWKRQESGRSPHLGNYDVLSKWVKSSGRRNRG